MITGNTNGPEGKTTPEQAPNAVNTVAANSRPNDALFATLAQVAALGTGKSADQAQSIADKSVASRVIDLPEMPFMKTAKMNICQNGALLLSLNNGKELFNHTVTQQERSALSSVLKDSSLTDDQKLNKVSNLVSAIAVTTQMSYNFNQEMAQNQSQANSMHR